MEIARMLSPTPGGPGPVVRRLAGLAMIALIIGIVAAAVVVHTDRGGGIRVFVDTDRAGLVLDPSAMVKLHGVQIGTVTAVDTKSGVRPGERGTTIELSVDDTAGPVPADVHAAIQSTTVFGAKYVTLHEPADAQRTTGVPRLADGDRIPADNVTVEIESLFETLNTVTSEVSPEKLSTVLTAVSQGVEDRGRLLGETLDDAADYIGMLAGRNETLLHDITAAADAADTYDGAAPQILDTLDHAATTSRTVSTRDDLLSVLLPDVIAMSDRATPMLEDNAGALADTAHGLLPTTALFDHYAPGIPCFFQGANTTRKNAEPVSGGNGATMLLRSTLLFGLDAYDPAENLPEVRATGGPRCGGLPELTMADVPAPYIAADTGANPVGVEPRSPQLLADRILWLLTGGPASEEPR